MFKLKQEVTITAFINGSKVSHDIVEIDGGTSYREGAISMIAVKIIDSIQEKEDVYKVANRVVISSNDITKSMSLTGITIQSKALSEFRGLAVTFAQELGKDLEETL